jgi:hypothetical protein
MKMKLVFLVAVLFLLGACALDPRRGEIPSNPAIVQPAPPSVADQLLTYMSQLRKLDTKDFAAEREQMRGAFLADRSELNRIKWALLLSMMPTTVAAQGTLTTGSANDDSELLALLEPFVNGPDAAAAGASTGTQEIRAMAVLLYGLAIDRKKLRDQWRDAQARLVALRKDESKELEARALRARVEELERKLDALKSIDRSVNRRSQAQRAEPQRDAPRN